MAHDEQRILSYIERCSDAGKLKTLVANAVQQGANDLADAARRKLYKVQASAEPGTLAFDVWESIHALEDALSSERGTTTRLSRTRQKIGRVGEMQTVIDLVAGSATASSGYQMLLDRGWPELTFEALALKHQMPADVSDRAKERLAGDGIDVPRLVAKMQAASE
jgi:hypothetical protein